jgi:cysteine desulfuration protein SufE
MSVDSELMAKIERVPTSLRAIIDEFRNSTPRERLELLLEYAQDLPDVPDHIDVDSNMEQVHECQTPVFLYTEVESNQVHFYLDIPAESPTVRGYAAIIAEGLDGVSPQEVLDTPEDVYMLLGLHEAITPQRLRGLHALVVYMKRQVKKQL